jgi:serine/threonine-protein kinase SRPK3
MKVLTAQVSTATACGMYKEADILHTLSHQDKSHPGYRYCPNMQHHQVIESANGAHYALFVRACGTTLGELSLQRPTRVFPPRVVARVMKELLLALTYVHDACNIIHCGRFKGASLHLAYSGITQISNLTTCLSL